MTVLGSASAFLSPASQFRTGLLAYDGNKPNSKQVREAHQTSTDQQENHLTFFWAAVAMHIASTKYASSTGCAVSRFPRSVVCSQCMEVRGEGGGEIIGIVIFHDEFTNHISI